jgi:D-Tyr-tRNA(Tyr) deacylase
MDSLGVKVFEDPSDPSKMWKSSVKDISGEILCVSQFTLFANTSKGNKPDFHKAMVRTYLGWPIECLIEPLPSLQRALVQCTPGFSRSWGNNTIAPKSKVHTMQVFDA